MRVRSASVFMPFHNAPACPTEACVADEGMVETEQALLAKAKKLHPGKDFSGNYPSHFKK